MALLACRAGSAKDNCGTKMNCHRKSEFRRPKSERRSKPEIRISMGDPFAPLWQSLRVSSLGLLSGFVIRPSSFWLPSLVILVVNMLAADAAEPSVAAHGWK